jgi:hypothetical protein
VDAIGRKERREEKNVVAYWEEFDLMTYEIFRNEENRELTL